MVIVGKYTIISLISLSKPFGTASQKPTENAAARTNLSLTGTARYASINAHRGAFHPGGGHPGSSHHPKNWEDCGPGKYWGNLVFLLGSGFVVGIPILWVEIHHLPKLSSHQFGYEDFGVEPFLQGTKRQQKSRENEHQTTAMILTCSKKSRFC